MNQQARATGNLERRIHDAERNLFAAVGADVEEFFLDLARTGLRVRVLSHGHGPAVVLLHGASESAAIWAPLFTELRHFRLLAVDLPGHGLSDPVAFRRGQVREHARRLIEDILDALGLDEVPVIGHSLGGMFALWHVAAGSGRICQVIAIGEPAVALPGVRVRMPLSLLTVRGLGVAVLRSPSPRRVYRALLAQGQGSAEIAAAPDSLIEALRLSVRRPGNARTVASLMHAIDRFRRRARECPHQRRARRDHDAHDLHPRIRRPLPVHRARTALDRPDSRRQALRDARRTRPLARRRPARGRADRNPLTPGNRPAPQPGAGRKPGKQTHRPDSLPARASARSATDGRPIADVRPGSMADRQQDPWPPAAAARQNVVSWRTC